MAGVDVTTRTIADQLARTRMTSAPLVPEDHAAGAGFRRQLRSIPLETRSGLEPAHQGEVHAADQLAMPAREAVEGAVAQPDVAGGVHGRLEAALLQGLEHGAAPGPSRGAARMLPGALAGRAAFSLRGRGERLPHLRGRGGLD